MQKLLSIFLALGLAAVPLFGQRSSQSIGTVNVEGNKTIPVRVTGTGELGGLANLAFKSHGHYSLVADSSATYSIQFSPVSATQVRVDVTKGGASVLAETVSGTSTRNALFRAADAAVKATSGAPGFFASKLAFVSTHNGKSEIFVSDLFGGEARQITHDNSQALTPRWSPDGTRLLYTSFFRSGFPDIFQIDLTSFQRTNFVTFRGTNSGARYSPNGSQVAMILSGEGNPELYVCNAQGRQVSRRTHTPDAVEASPCYSPDGSRIVYVSDSAGSAQLYVMSSAGGSAQRLSTGYSYSAEPDWSRGDSSKIAFTAGVGRAYQIAVYDLSGKNPTKVISRAALDAVEPSWLADGRHLIYTARAANKRSLCILDTETGFTRQLSAEGIPAEKASVWGP